VLDMGCCTFHIEIEQIDLQEEEFLLISFFIFLVSILSVKKLVIATQEPRSHRTRKIKQKIVVLCIKKAAEVEEEDATVTS